jgi:hypothetical protein
MKKHFSVVRLILLIGILLRIYAAVSHIDTVHPDEHFQNLEPASKIIFGYGWMSWEWTVGSRSWFVPALYMPLLLIFKLLGFSGGPAPIVGCRIMMALLSGWMLFRMDALFSRRGISEVARGFTALFYALSPAFVAWGATTLSDTWATLFLWIALPTIIDLIDKKTPKSWFWGGLLVGLPFLARLQMLAWPAGMFLVLLFRKPGLRLLRAAAAGFIVPVLFQGILDWATWGAPFHSVIMNVKKNLFENVAAFYGVSPFNEYFKMLWANFGEGFWYVYFGLIAAAIIGFVLIGSKKFPAANGSKQVGKFSNFPTFQDALVLVPVLIYFFAHCLIGHKENRFILPLYPALFYVLAISVQTLIDQLSKVIPALVAQLQKWSPALVLIAPVLAYASVSQLYTPEHFYQFDLGELMLKVRDDGALDTTRCVALLDHYWIWSHGEMLQGHPVRFIEISSSHPFPPELRGCAYAVMPGGRGQLFESHAGLGWHAMGEDSRGQLVYKNEFP